MKFNEKMRLLRKKNKMSQSELAAAIGVSRQSVYKWEDGKAFPEIERIIRMKDLFRCSLDDLFDDGMSVSDDGTLKTNEEVEYEIAHRKVRKPRKDKGIKTGIPPMRKDGTPVVKPRKNPVAEEKPKKEEKKPAVEKQPLAVPVYETQVAPAPAPAPASAPIPEAPAYTPRQPAFRTRREPMYGYRPMSSQRRFSNDSFDNDLLDELNLADEMDLSDVKSFDAIEEAPAPTQASAPPAAEPERKEETPEVKKRGGLFGWFRK